MSPLYRFIGRWRFIKLSLSRDSARHAKLLVGSSAGGRYLIRSMWTLAVCMFSEGLTEQMHGNHSEI